MINRTAEFVLGLVGGIIGILISVVGLFFGLIGFMAEDPEVAWAVIIVSVFFLLIQVAALVMSCLVKRMNNKLYGGLMITWGILSFPISFLCLFQVYYILLPEPWGLEQMERKYKLKQIIIRV